MVYGCSIKCSLVIRRCTARDSKAAALVLQVHKAKLKFSGTIVAVKVQYPDSLNVMLQVSLCLGNQGPLKCFKAPCTYVRAGIVLP